MPKGYSIGMSFLTVVLVKDEPQSTRRKKHKERRATSVCSPCKNLVPSVI